MDLGTPVKKAPGTVYRPEEWESAAFTDVFASAGGREPVSYTQLQMMWDRKCLYLRVVCRENSERVPRFSDDDPLCLRWMDRRDRVEIALSSGSFGRRDYAVFHADSSGASAARTELGMTYYGGDHAILNDYYTEKNEAVITEIPAGEYVCAVTSARECWQVFFAVPWALFGGFPEERFYFQVYRKKNQTSEVLSLSPLDLNENYDSRFDFDPETFVECTLNGTRDVSCATSACVILGSGIMHWQRPAVLRWPSANERAAILELQNTASPTTRDNLSDRIVTVQQWQDVLMLEGLDFFPNARCENSFEKVDPWVQRRLCNEALRRGDTAAACHEIDVLIDYFRTLTAWWYADHTLGNADEGSWTGFEMLKSVSDEGDRILLCFEHGSRTCSAVLIPLDSGFRFFTGEKGDFDCTAAPYTCVAKGESFRIGAGRGTIEITSGRNWSIRAGNRFVLSGKNFRLYNQNGSQAFDVLQPLAENEMIYGFGERFDAVNQRGRVLSLWHRDAFEGCNCSIGNQSYKNVSLLHSTKGYALFVNSFYRIWADIGRIGDGLRVTAAGPKADIYVFVGTPAENLDAYTKLTGRPLLPPDWVFEPWAGGGVGRWKDGPTHDVVQEMEGVIRRFKNLDIPHSGLYAEGAGWQWRDHYRKEEVYRIASFCRDEGLKVFSWQFSHVTPGQAEKLLPDCPLSDLPVTRTPGCSGEKPLPSVIDFSHPLAEKMLEAQWHDRLDAGFDGTMVDFGEIVPDEAVFHDGRRGDEMHNAYALEYTKAYRKLFEKYKGNDHVLFSRSAAAGVQQYACQFGGDQLSSFRGLTYAISGGLSLAASGLPFWGVDTGGYSGFPDEETYLRWIEFSAFSPIMRFHGVTPREPWVYSRYATAVYKYYAWLRENLLRYAVHTAYEAHSTGLPVMRILPVMYPEDEQARRWEDEYFYGPDLLVAPVHSEAGERQVYFPEGRWISLFDNSIVSEGKECRRVEAPIDRIPVYVREGACIPSVLNGELTLGESMTYEKLGALFLSRSSRPIAGERRTGREKMTYAADGEGTRASFTIRDLTETGYLILMGFETKPAELHVNGQRCEEAPSLNALRYTAGWYQREDLTVVIRIRPVEKIQVDVFLPSVQADGAH